MKLTAEPLVERPLRHVLLTIALMSALFGSDRAHAGPPAGECPKSYYIDLGDPGSTPSDAYAGAANVAGHWNQIPISTLPLALQDTLGNANGEQITLLAAGPVMLTHLTTLSGDDHALLSDFAGLLWPSTWSITGLPAGDYDVIVHSFRNWDPLFRSTISLVTQAGTTDLGDCGGTFGSTSEPYVLGTTHVSGAVSVAGSGAFAGRLDVHIDCAFGEGALNGIQILPRPNSFFLDVGANPASTPYLRYAAAGSTPGHWRTVAAAPLCFTVEDVLGAQTCGACPMGPTYTNLNVASTLTGDDADLMNDFQDVGSVGNSVTWQFFVGPGSYYVNVYAWAPDLPSSLTDVTVSGGGPAQTCGGAVWGGAHQIGNTYVQAFATTTTGWFDVTLTTVAGFGSFNGIQFIPRVPTCSEYFCFGDLSGTACPCGNASGVGAGEGCLNSLGVGARLRTSGVASLSSDSLVLEGSQMPNSSALYFQGTLRASGGAGLVFGDGLRCAAGAVLRLGTKFNVGGGSVYPSVGDASISVRGVVTSPGSTRTYQCWYRNSSSFCTPSTFNLTNGAALTWTP